MQRDANAVDLNQQRVVLAPDIVVWPVRERGELVYRFEIPAEHKFFRVGYAEYVFISLLDGDTTIPQACGMAAAKLREKAPSAKQASSIQRWLLRNRLAYLSGQDPPSRNTRPTRDENLTTVASKFNPFWIKVPLVKSSHAFSKAFFETITRPTVWLFSPLSVLLSICLMLIAVVTLMENWNEFSQSSRQVFSPANWIYLFMTWVGLKLVHESAHAAACHRLGGEVREFGLAFVLFAPLAYVDVTSCWRMPSRWPRIQVAAAGMFAECLIAAIGIFAWRYTDNIEIRFWLHNLIVAAGLTTILFNANALMRFDGYFILADLVEIPNLYSLSTSEVKRIAKRIVFGVSDSPLHYGGWRLWFVRIYGASAMLWKVVICVTLGVTASTMFSGAGIVLTALGICLWLGKPLTMFLRYVSTLMQFERPRAFRGLLVATVLLVVSTSLAVLAPIPTSVVAPAVVQFKPETFLRSGVDGFVREIHVKDSQRVKAGDLILELENRELDMRRKRLEIALAKNELQYREAIKQADASGQLVFRQHRESLEQQLGQVTNQSTQLQLRAPRDGRVVARELPLRLGTYVREGEHLVTVANPQDKEIVAVVHQENIRTARRQLNDTVQIRTAGFRSIRGRLDRVDPRATSQLSLPSLASTEDGPLAVQMTDQEDEDGQSREARLLDPHFYLRVGLDGETATTLNAGMRLQAFVGYSDESALTRLQREIQRLWRNLRETK